MAFFRQFRLILWKNFILQKRKPCVTVFEILLPVVFAALLVILRTIIHTTDVKDPKEFADFLVDTRFFTTQTKFFFAPNSPEVLEYMKIVSNMTSLGGIPCKDEDDLLRQFEQTGVDTRTIFGGVVVEGDFPGNGSLPKQLTFKIRPVTGKDDNWFTRNMYPFFQTNNPRTNETDGGPPKYLARGFLSVQTALVYALIQQRQGSVDLRFVNQFLNMMPYPPYHNDPFLIVLQTYFPFLLMLGFILNTLQNTKNIVYEKERKLKESMKMMGLSNFAHWSAWFTKCFLYLVVAIVLFTVLCVIPAGPLHISVIGHTDPSLFFVFLLVYALSIVAFCFAISSFFSKANIGAAASGIVFFVTFLPYFFLQSRYEVMTTAEKLAACILPNMAMAFGVNVIGLFEGTGEGAQWSNFHLPATVDDNFTLLEAMLMLVAMSAFLFLITWYVDAVFPGEFGVPKPWYFPFLKSYWCGAHSNAVDFQEESDIEGKKLSDFFEREPTGLQQGIQIKHLRKEFGDGDNKTVAVAGTNLNMYCGQITVLLGHNGAGKTTTMSMLTGFLAPTSGTAVVNGFDIRSNLSDVRKCLGLCPQHDILFDSLTVMEHMVFFARLKGYPEERLKEEVDNVIKIIGLQEKTNARSCTLSGGQKRKLSVGIALVAGSKIIILDEPTSGMDPQARREMWTILQKYKKDRTILLTTHFMDEADILGDRIAIMAEGVVKCCGTSLFLKNKYGSGYHLTLVKNAGCDVRDVTNLITSNIPSARTDCDTGAELTYILPNDESPKFEQLFGDLQNRMGSLGIASFGVSVTTMEEVFLRVGEGATDDPEMMNYLNKHGAKEATDQTIITKGSGYDNPNFELNEQTVNGIVADTSHGNQSSRILGFNQDLEKNMGLALVIQQFKAAVVKKMLHTWRNRTVTLVQLMLPIIFTIIALVVDKTSQVIEDEPPLTLDMSHFKKNFAYYRLESSAFGDEKLASCFNETFQGTNTFTSQVDHNQYDSLESFFLQLGRQVGVSLYNREYILGASLEAMNPSRPTLTGFFNGQLYHSVAISATYMLNTLLKYSTELASSVTMINYPLPKNAQDDPEQQIVANSFVGFTIAFCILFGMAFLSSSYVLFIIRERNSQSKHIQLVCGLRHWIFWVANFTWDYINYLFPCTCLLIVFAAFGTESYNEERLAYVFIILLLYGWAILPFVYMFHFAFTTAASGLVALVMLNIFTGLVTLLAVVIMELPDLGTEDIANVLGWIFSVLLPNYCFGQSFLSLYTNYIFVSACEKANYKVTCELLPTLPCCKGTCEGNQCFKFEENYLAWNTPGIGRYLTFMGLQGFLYFALVFLVEYGVIRRIWYSVRPLPEFCAELANREEDSDVAAERERVREKGIITLSRTDSLVMENVTKSYDGYVAVERLSLGIPQNECFGLLGVNGAGKTSTFKMLTGDEIISGGDARLKHHDVKTEITKVQANLGYCPQFDALIDQMTGRETLTMFARLKGIQEKRIQSVVSELMNLLILEEHADKLVKKYSGGNKRKLSTAISLIGDPPVIFLDEPTTGVDPAARRQLWNVLSEIRAAGSTLVLTSHSMEECDALCTRIAIMVNGRFLCLGSPQHLKNKFGQGYSLIARISDSAEEFVLSDFMNFIETTFPYHDLVDSGNGYVNYHLKDPSISLAVIFGTLEQAKETYSIEDYSVSQTTLQQVFVDFARKQVPPREISSRGFCKTLCCCCCCSN